MFNIRTASASPDGQQIVP